MKRKKVSLTDSKKAVKADTSNSSSKELKHSQASGGRQVRDLALQGKTSNTDPKVKLKKLETSVIVRRGRSRSSHEQS